MSPTVINIAELYGKFCITAEDGDALHDRLVPLITKNVTVDLDFHGVDVFASPFLNASVGALLRDFKPEQLNAHVRFLHLTTENASLFRRVIQNAREYYAKASVRAIVDRTVKGGEGGGESTK